MTQPIRDEERQEDERYEGDGPADTAGGPPDVASTMGVDVEPVEAPVDADQALAAERERAQVYLDELQRERASFINYRRRMEADKENWSRDANAALIFNLLAVLDDFERAKANIPPELQGTPWVEGLMLVERKLYSTLELAGLKPIEAEGQPFDPARHEAVVADPTEEHEPSRVLEEYRRGYTLGDRVLRPSMVKVSQ